MHGTWGEWEDRVCVCVCFCAYPLCLTLILALLGHMDLAQ